MNPLAALVPRTETRTDFPSLSWDEWLSYFTFNGHAYQLGLNQTLKSDRESIDNNFVGYVNGAYKANGIVFAVMLVRLLLFSQARFAWRDIGTERLSYTPELDRLRRPWTGATTGDLLGRTIQDADLAGNFYGLKTRTGVRRRRPDWTDIITGESELDGVEDVIGYLYHPNGRFSGTDPIFYLPDEVTHFAPIPDPIAEWRGMSWLTPVVREIMADSAATKHKLKFFENGATPNMLVKSPVGDVEKFRRWVEIMEERHKGVSNAYRTMYLGAGADATVVGTNFQQLDFKVTQGAGETRIAAAGGVPQVVVGLSEGLQGSSLNAGNYGQARRRLSDGTLWPLWENLAGSYATIVREPPGKELWIDTRGVKFLREDKKDAADIQSTQAQSIRSLVDAGFTPVSVVTAITGEDLSALAHTDLFSVQLQAAGGGTQEAPADDRDIGELVNAVGILIRSGFDPQAALTAVGLDPIEHFGLLPVTLQNPSKVGVEDGELTDEPPDDPDPNPGDS